MKATFLFTICLFALMAAKAQSIDTVVQKDNAPGLYIQNELAGYTGPCGCSGVVPMVEFEQILSDIKSSNQDVRMLTYAKHIIRDKCLLTAQIKAITLLFTYDDTRSNFVKFASHYIYDRGNYFDVLRPYLVPSISTAFGQSYTRNEANRIWVNKSYSNETARRAYYYGY